MAAKKTLDGKARNAKGIMHTAAKAASSKTQPETKRLSVNSDLPQDEADEIAEQFTGIRALLEKHAANLSPLDRQRLNGIGIKIEGFANRAYEYAVENGSFLPKYLSIEKFSEDRQHFVNFRMLYDLCTQIRELIWNQTMQSADVFFSDAREFYVSTREAGKHGIDGAETIFDDLKVFYKRIKTKSEKITRHEAKRHANALIDGAREGKIAIVNVKPKLKGGKHKVVDEKFD